MGAYSVEPAHLKAAGRRIHALPSTIRATGGEATSAAAQASAACPGFQLAEALDEFAQQYSTVVQRLTTVLEDHGGGLVNGGRNYETAERNQSWMFRRLKDGAV